MKKGLFALSLVALGVISASAQGTINYNNLITGLRAPVFGVEPGDTGTQRQGQPTSSAGNNATPLGSTVYTAAPLSGTGFTAELWAGTAGNLSAVPGSATPFRTGSTAGYITSIATLAVPQVALNSSGSFQLRAWDNQGGTVTSWAMVLANMAVPRGTSTEFTATTGGGGNPPALPGNLSNLTSFNLFVPVPEPSVIALGALGLGALLFRRIRK